MGTRKYASSQVVWSLLATLVLLATYFLPAWLRSVAQYDTSSVMLSMKASLLSPTLFWWQLGYYLFMVLLVHFLFFYLLAEVVRIRYAGKARAWRTLVLWLAAVLFLQTVNSGFFPHSSQSFELGNALHLDRLTPWLAAMLLALLLVLGAAHVTWRAHVRLGRRFLLALGVLAVAWLSVTVHANWQGGQQASLPANRPNIILIGVDALIPEQLAYMHNQWDPGFKAPMPYLDSQLEKSVVFSRAYTSVARTYPSWIATLTGMDALHSGVRFNLQDDYDLWQGKVRTLPQYLKQIGYQTLWAIDESSFANIGHRHGFDRVVSPEPGAAALLVGMTMADMPLVNLLSNSRMGAVVFPVTSSNRALGFSYYPSTFSDRLNRAVEQAKADQPLFLAVHLELAHYPVIWADDGAPTSVTDIYNQKEIGWRFYRYSLTRIDRQIEELMDSLQRNGRLQDAIVVFLSDHGNGYFTGQMGKDRFGHEVYVGDVSTGHGTDIANLLQQNAVLAVRGYGEYRLDPGFRDNLVALMDVTPTLMKALGIKSVEPMQGEPLDLFGVDGGQRRTLFFESGLYFAGLASGRLDLAGNLAKKSLSYRIRKNGRLVLRASELEDDYRIQNRAAFDGRNLLLQIWNPKKKYYTVGVANMKIGRFTPLDENFLYIPGVAELALDFCRHYAQDPWFEVPAFCAAITVKTDDH